MTPQEKLAPYKLTDRVLLDGLTDDFATRLYAVLSDERLYHRVHIVSAFRTYEQQKALYDAWRNGTYDVPSVAKPGTSRHETGVAADLGIGWGSPYGWSHVHAVAREYAMRFPVPGEAWHIETVPGAPPFIEEAWLSAKAEAQINDLHAWMSSQDKANPVLAQAGNGINRLDQVVAAVQDTAKWTLGQIDAAVGTLSDEDLKRIADAVNNEAARRLGFPL